MQKNTLKPLTPIKRFEFKFEPADPATHYASDRGHNTSSHKSPTRRVGFHPLENPGWNQILPSSSLHGTHPGYSFYGRIDRAILRGIGNIKI